MSAVASSMDLSKQSNTVYSEAFIRRVHQFNWQDRLFAFVTFLFLRFAWPEEVFDWAWRLSEEQDCCESIEVKVRRFLE